MRTKSKRKKVIEGLSHHWKPLRTIGNWFILCQIGRNSNAYFFRRFLDELNSEEVEIKVDKETQENENSGIGDSVETTVLENEDQDQMPVNEAQPKISENGLPLYHSISLE